MLVTFQGSLIAQAIPSQLKYWIIYEPYTAVWRTGRSDIPKFYVTDFASIPRIAWNIIYPLDLRIAWIAPHHDLAYETHGISKDDADSLLYWGMLASGADQIIAGLCYRAVRDFGGSAYNSGPRRREERRKFAGTIRQLTGGDHN